MVGLNVVLIPSRVIFLQFLGLSLRATEEKEIFEDNIMSSPPFEVFVFLFFICDKVIILFMLLFLFILTTYVSCYSRVELLF